MAKVFVFEQSCRYDLTTASVYGELYHLYGPGDRRPSIFTDEYQKSVLDRLDALNYQPGADYIVVAGSIVAIATLVGAVVREYSPAKFLMFNAGTQQYVEVVI